MSSGLFWPSEESQAILRNEVSSFMIGCPKSIVILVQHIKKLSNKVSFVLKLLTYVFYFIIDISRISIIISVIFQVITMTGDIKWKSSRSWESRRRSRFAIFHQISWICVCAKYFISINSKSYWLEIEIHVQDSATITSTSEISPERRIWIHVYEHHSFLFITYDRFIYQMVSSVLKNDMMS